MSDRESSPPSEVDDLLAPPPFGVAEATSEQLLPIPTSMEELLDAPEPELPAEEPTPPPTEDPLPPLASVPAAARAEVAAPSAPNPPRPAVAAQPPPRRSGTPIVIAAVVVLGLGGLAGWLLTRNAPQSNDGGVSSAAVQPTPAPPTADAPSPEPRPGDAAKTLPTSRKELEAMSFKDRHALLATARGDVSVELHVGLDLLQAKQAEDPCRTFADALNTIEASDDTEVYRWALAGAEAPAGVGPACNGLQARLDALNAPEPVAETPTPSRRKRPARKRPRAASPAAPTPPPAAPAAAPKPQPPAKPATSPSVATKLDDDLRGLGD